MSWSSCEIKNLVKTISNKPSLVISSGCAVICMLLPLWVYGDISLDASWSLKAKQEISALVETGSGKILLADQRANQLIMLDDEKLIEVNLSKKPQVFKSSGISGMTMAAEGMVLLSSRRDSKLALVSQQGEFMMSIGQEGAGAGEISEPRGIVFSTNRRIYIADEDNNRIAVFGPDGVFLQNIGNADDNESQGLRKPIQVYIDPQERIYVLEATERGRVSIYKHDGKLIKRLEHKVLEKMLGKDAEFTAMNVDSHGLIYLADSEQGRVYQLDWKSNKKVNAFGSKGSERGQFGKISALLPLKDGRIAVADRENYKVEIYNIKSYASKPEEQVYLPTVSRYLPVKMQCKKAYRMPESSVLCINKKTEKLELYSDKSKRIKEFSDIDQASAVYVNHQYIAIIDNDRVKVFDHAGKKITTGKGFGGYGAELGKLKSPQSLFVRNDKVYVADTGNQRIQVFTVDGIYLDSIHDAEEQEERIIQEPVSVVVDAQNNIYVADRGNSKLHVYDEENNYLYSLGGEARNAPFNKIYDMAIDADNNVYVLCGERNNEFNIQVYNGPKRIISFLAESDDDTGVEDPVNISVSVAGRNLLGVYDAEKSRLLNYSYQQVPQQVGNVVISGALKHTEIKWSKVPGSFIKGYNVFGAKRADDKYEFVNQVKDGAIKITHDKNIRHTFYKINAFAGLGSVGRNSRPVEDVFSKGYRFYEMAEFGKLVDIFGASLEENPDQPDMLKYYGLSLLELGESLMAVSAFRQMEKYNGYEIESQNLQIRALLSARDYIAARAIVDKLIALNSIDDDTFLFCGELNLKMGDVIGAVTCLEEAVKRKPEDIDARYYLGDAYVKLGIVEKGMAEFEKATEISPENSKVWYRVGVLLSEMGELDEAIEKFEKSLDVESSYVPAKLALAQLFLKKKQFSKAKNIAISLAGNEAASAEGYYLLGLVALEEDKTPEALLAFAKATRINRQYVEAWLELANVYSKMGNSDKEYSSLKSAVSEAPYSYEAMRRLGQHEYALELFDLAAKTLETAVTMRPDEFMVNQMLADSMYRTGEYSEAKRYALKANKLNVNHIDTLVLLSRINARQGKVGAAIEYMKQAMIVKPESDQLLLEIGKLYSENNLYDVAQSSLEKAALLKPNFDKPHVFLGDLFLKRRMFDKAISAYDKAVSLLADANNRLKLDLAYSEKKKSLDFKSNAPQIVLKDLHLDKVFSAAYKKYANNPVGRIRIKNASGTEYRGLTLTFSIKGYMDFPTSVDVPRLSANESLELDLKAAFNNRILEIDEDTGVQVEVALNFVRDGRQDSIKMTSPMTIFGKNAIAWKEANMIGAFVTPKDDTLRDFVRAAINENKPVVGPLSDNLVTAMTLFDVFTAHEIRYVVDPNNPFSEISDDRVDYVQFGRETLKIKSGDCDDLTVLMSAGLENLGIETAILDVPGHLLFMFDSGVPVTQKDRISLQDNLMVEVADTIWIPVEATMIGTSFAEAWAEGARKYYKYADNKSLQITMMRDAWKEFQPVTLNPANYTIDVPSKERVEPLVSREQNILLQKSLDRLVKPYEVMSQQGAGGSKALMQVAIIYAKYGLYSKANMIFDKIILDNPDDSAVHNNRGNIHYAQGDFQRALETYVYAEQLAANDPGVKVNMAMSYYQMGQLDKAREKFSEAKMINRGIDKQYSGLSQLLAE